MKIFLILSLVALTSCATEFKEAYLNSDGTSKAYGFRIEQVQNLEPFTHYAAFTGNSETSAQKARAFTEMAALKHCREQNRFLIIDSNVRNVRKERDGDPMDYQSFMVLFGCSDKNSATKINERKRILSAFCKAKESRRGEFCSPKSKYRF